MGNLQEKLILLEKTRIELALAARDPNVHADGYYAARDAASGAWKGVRADLKQLSGAKLLSAEENLSSALSRSGNKR